MCIISLAWRVHPKWKLIAIGNRDELHERPAEPLTHWENSSHILAGRDIKAGGTWLGISERGRFAAITNRSGFGPPDSNLTSRGDLLRDFLSGEGTYSNPDIKQFADFNPFNLFTIADNILMLHTNQPHSSSEKLAPGLYGLSNGSPDNPWPKSEHLGKMLAEWMKDQSGDPASLLDILTNQTTYHPQIAGAGKEQAYLEPRNSGIFICGPVYGTRCSTVVAIDNEGKGQIIERRYLPSCEQAGDTSLSFSWPQ